MLFGVWRHPQRDGAWELAEQVASVVDAPGSDRFATANAALTVWSPATLERRGALAIGLAYSPASNSGWSLSDPRAELEGETVTIACGPLPQYPLYYAAAPDGLSLLFSSRLEPLSRLFPRASIDAERLVSAVVWGVQLDSAATPYAGVRRLRPGETVIAGSAGIHVTRAFPAIATAYRRARVEDLAVELRYHLDVAIGRAMEGSRRVAVLVSGGLDSSAVLALAAARCRGGTGPTLTAVSVQYAAPGDDRPYLAELAAKLEVDVVRRGAEEAGRWFRSSLCADAQPVLLASTCLSMLMNEAAREGRPDVVLTGVGGDRICGGPLPFAQVALRGHPLAALMMVLRLRGPWRSSTRERLRALTSPLVPRALRRLKRRWAPRPGWMTPRFRTLLARVQAAAEPPSQLPDSPDAWLRELCTRDFVLDGADLGGQGAVVSGCAPVDVFADWPFVRFMLELDPVILSLGNEFRGLFRLAMKGVLPERIRCRQDKATFEPGIAAAAVAAGAGGLLRDLASFEALAGHGLVDPPHLGASVQEWLVMMAGGRVDSTSEAVEYPQRIWQLLSVEAFLREHGGARRVS